VSALFWMHDLEGVRRGESSSQLQARYNEWEAQNPVWARRLTGPGAAAALGYGRAAGSETSFCTRSEMLQARRTASREASMRASGFDERTQKVLTSHIVGDLTTSITRSTVNPGLTWCQEPAARSRSQLQVQRAADNVRLLVAASERNAHEGALSSEARVQRRTDQSIVFLHAARRSESRAEMLQRRRQERGRSALASYLSYQPAQSPSFASQTEPFWNLQREQGDGREPSTYMTSTESAHYRVAGRQAAADQKCTATVLSATKAAGGVANATAVASVAEDQLQSAEMLKAHQRWWAKPDAFPSVAPPQPSREDPFKLAPDDTAYLHRKLSSGPKRSQRGYPSETRHVAEKITNQPPPPSFELPTDPRMAQFHQTTSAAFKFLAAEPRDVHSQDQTSADGYGPCAATSSPQRIRLPALSGLP